MSGWIHCNKCFLRFQPNIKFYLTACGHIMCENCVRALGPDKQCPVCNSACDLAELSNNLKPDIQCFFRPYSESALSRKQVYTFQYDNIISLLKQISGKYNARKGEIGKHYKIIQDLKKQNAKLKMMISSTTRGEFAASTPAAGTSTMNVSACITPIRIPSSRFMPWNQQTYSAERTGHQQYTQVNSSTSKLIPTFGGLQSTTSFIPARSNNEAENPAMISLPRLRIASNNGSY